MSKDSPSSANRFRTLPFWLPEAMTRQQWLVLLAAWIGWVFDSMDSTLFAMIMLSSLQDLLGPTANKASIAAHGGIILAVFLVGWAVGGTLFGTLADYIGRSRTLSLSILVYAVFTGVAALSETWTQLMVFRFLTALGIGGEWAAGSSLVAESFPDKYRTRVVSLMQSAWGAGFFLAALVNLFVVPWAAAHYFTPWRAVLVIGIFPALSAAFIREKVGEPEPWLRVRQRREKIKLSPERSNPKFTVLTLKQIFWPGLRRDTIVGSLLAFTAVFGLWAVTNWTPTFVVELLRGRAYTEATVSNYQSYATMALNAGAVVGYVLFGPLADWIGRKKTFLFFFTGSLLLAPYVFYTVKDYVTLLLLLPILGFFNNGVFSGFPIYLAELYPTRLRATGQGFCFNFGRILAATGPLSTGLLVSTLGSYARAVTIVSLIYIVGIVTLIWARETKGQPLPDE
ncbi:Major facilitator superfamily transporter [Acididesulfobacillus acetoxydans]|uniref:Cis,cis-muconate transport protein n=1 Tax=Acididesulfobacillus acetoxydans TaxID=1561005 RepID=A0A8S0WP14_9FIRM|nr:MFS transporter [Acididesulfobacillus acetoxydans]CAA7601604.1 Major facilitator superfamily transporter [Acididesulfobacillus acetoxydans]CEJ07091.1 Cis,cis-muconate transport protein [Acididesulfobacillus acetoxydans]